MNEKVFDFFPELNTRSLKLRRITQEDDKSLLEILSDEITCKYLTQNAVKDMTSIAKLITRMNIVFQEKQRIRWGIAKKEDNNLIGHCGYFDIDRNNSIAEISYCLKSDSCGKGKMTEALDEMLKFGFYSYGLNRIVAKVMEDNISSIKVLVKLGFVKEGLLRESFYKNGEYHNLIIFSILESEYGKKITK